MKDFSDISIIDLAGLVASHLASHDIQVVLDALAESRKLDEPDMEDVENIFVRRLTG